MSDKRKAFWFIFDAAIFVAVGFILFQLIAGCTFSLKDNGEIGFRQSTTWGFFHETSKSQSSEMELEAPSVEEWLFKGDTNANDNVSSPPPVPVVPDNENGGDS